jgi:hypothetical protein
MRAGSLLGLAVTLASAAGFTVIVHGCGSGNPGSGFRDPETDAGTTPPDVTCPIGQTACDGKCVDLASDTKACGGCNQSCSGDDHCCAGKCVQTATCAFAVMNVEPQSGMVNGGDWLTLKGAGFAKGMKVFIGDGRAPVRVVDATTARVQTPPGPLGDADVRIELAGQTAIYKKAFLYVQAGLLTPWKEIPMSVVRGEMPGLAVLQDGRVLIAGGTTVPDDFSQSVDTMELFLRKDEKVVAAAGTMGTRRWHSSAVTLLDGHVLVVGANCGAATANCNGNASTADLFDPAAGTTAKKALQKERTYARSVLMPDGRVLISSANDPSLEIYDPDADTFTLVPHSQAHVFGFMVRLRDGRVLLGGGDGGVTAADIFDPDTNQLRPTANAMKQGRSMVTAHTLPDGRVMIVGGASLSAGGINAPLDSIELYDPKTDDFTAAPYKLSIGRTWHASALVRDGTVLAMGGYTVQGVCDSSVGTVDQIDPVKGTVTPFAALPNNKKSTEWNAVTLLDGSIVAVGGGACGTTQALPEIYFLPGAPVAK